MNTQTLEDRFEFRGYPAGGGSSGGKDRADLFSAE